MCLLLPVGRGVHISLTDLDFLRNSNEFIGLANYGRALSDPDFYWSLGRNLIYVVVVVVFNFLIGFGMAMVCNRRFAGERVVRTVLIVPMLLIPVAAATLWRFMYNYDIGVINKTLVSLGIGRVNWLGNLDMVLYSIIITDIWAWTPWMFLILLAGLEGIPTEQVEAARIDGASGLEAGPPRDPPPDGARHPGGRVPEGDRDLPNLRLRLDHEPGRARVRPARS